MARSLLVAVSPLVLLRLGERRVWGLVFLMCQSPQLLQPPHHLHLQLFTLVCFSNYLVNGEAIHPTGLCLIWVQGHCLQLRSCPPLFHDFWHFNVKVMAAHHPVIQWEVDELLAKGANEPSSGGAGFYSSMFVVPKHPGGLQPILNLKHFNCYMLIPSFKMPTLKHVWQLIQHGDYAFSIDLQDVYLHIPIVKLHHHSLRFVWHNLPYQGKVLPFGLATGPRVFMALTKPILFLCHQKCFCIVFYLDDILALVHSKQAGKRVHCFCVPCWSVFVYISIFPSLAFASLRPFVY